MCACSLRPQAGFGSPRPNAGEGVGVRGNPIEWISTRNPALDEGFGALQDQSAVCSPPHPMKASQAFILFPRWGEGNRSRLSFSSDNEFCHYILRSSVAVSLAGARTVHVPKTRHCQLHDRFFGDGLAHHFAGKFAFAHHNDAIAQREQLRQF